MDTDALNWFNGEAVIADLTIDAGKGSMVANGTKFATFQNFEFVSFRSFDPISGAFDYTGFAAVDTIYLGAASSVINTFDGNDGVTVTAGTAVVSAGSGDDILRSSFPNSAQVTLHGDDGADVIQANNSHAQVFGGKGNDDLSLSFVQSQIGGGAAMVNGGAGQDVLLLTLYPTATDLVLNLSTPTITLANGAFITGVEGVRLKSTSGNDSIIASNDARGAVYNTVDGGFGNDTLTASANGAALNGSFGTDVLQGGAGNDALSGGFGAENDTLRGAGGDDPLIGSIGRDLLVGGGGADHFTLTEYYESGTTNTTRDLIADFSQAQGDRIDLSVFDAEVVVASPGIQDFHFIGTAAFGNVAGELRYEKVNLAGTANDITRVSGDRNADGTADFMIELTGIFSLQVTDFAL